MNEIRSWFLGLHGDGLGFYSLPWQRARASRGRRALVWTARARERHTLRGREDGTPAATECGRPRTVTAPLADLTGGRALDDSGKQQKQRQHSAPAGFGAEGRGSFPHSCDSGGKNCALTPTGCGFLLHVRATCDR